LQIGVNLRGVAHASERIDEFDRRAPDRLMHAALERGLVVEERRAVPGNPEQADIVE
jgi:hypothetical protein